jgi:hypothetical protein
MAEKAEKKHTTNKLLKHGHKNITKNRSKRRESKNK